MNKYFLIKGNHTSGITTQSYLTYEEVITSSNISIVPLSIKDIKLGIKNIPWIKGSKYLPYSKDNSSNSYVMYDQRVYLCLSNNDLNKSNTPNNSKFPPHHNIGKFSYPDGYTWLYLYSITSDVLGFLNSNTIPVPSNYMLNRMVNFLETDSILCTNGNTGTCAIYLTDSSKKNANLIYQQGISCEVCKNIAEETTKTDLLTTDFYEQEQVSASISIKSKQQILNEFIDSNLIIPNLNFEAKTFYNAKLSGISNGAILNAMIDIQQLEGLSLSYSLLTNDENIISFTGGNGTGAVISFNTIPENNKLKIIGIKLSSGGMNYSSVFSEIYLPGITNSEKRDAIKNSIKLEIPPRSLVFTDINSIFDVGSENSLGKTNINKIINCQIDAYDPAINYYGLIEADSNIEETVYELCPSLLRIYPFSSTGTISEREYLNLNFNQPISQTEINMR
jgi:hypothetical protein